MLTILKTSTLATGLEKVSFNSNLKERQCQRMLKLPCRGPASAGSRGTLRMNGIGERDRDRDRERDQTGGVQQSLANILFFTVAFIF